MIICLHIYTNSTACILESPRYETNLPVTPNSRSQISLKMTTRNSCQWGSVFSLWSPAFPFLPTLLHVSRSLLDTEQISVTPNSRSQISLKMTTRNSCQWGSVFSLWSPAFPYIPTLLHVSRSLLDMEQISLRPLTVGLKLVWKWLQETAASEGVSLVYDHLPSHIYQLYCMSTAHLGVFSPLRHPCSPWVHSCACFT